MASTSNYLEGFTNKIIKTSTGKITLIVLISTLITTSTILSIQSNKRTRRRLKLKEEIDDRIKEEEGDDADDRNKNNTDKSTSSTSSSISANIPNTSRPSRPTSEIIILEALARNYVFFGEEGMKKIRNSFVIVVGLGGVGSACATMLVRSGVGKIRLIDFDQVSLSSLNRHATATLAQVGTPKVTSCEEAFKATAPWVEVDPRIALFGKEEAGELLGGNPDYVIDCIDNMDSKIELLVYCHSHKIPVFSSLGAGAKSDPSRIQVADISDSFEDPFARRIRRHLRLKNIYSGIPTVFSTEIPRASIGLLPLPEEEFQKGKQSVSELSALEGFRVRILPVLGPIPAMFGNAAAAYVLQSIGGFEMEPLPYKSRTKSLSSIHKNLTSLEYKLNGCTRIPLNEQDIQYFYEEIHRVRSVVPPFAVLGRPNMMRWKKNEPLVWSNVVIFEQAEGDRHIEHCLIGNEDPEIYWGEECTKMVNKRIEEERRISPTRL